jgi:hypothetical protein
LEVWPSNGVESSSLHDSDSDKLKGKPGTGMMLSLLLLVRLVVDSGGDDGVNVGIDSCGVDDNTILIAEPHRK